MYLTAVTSPARIFGLIFPPGAIGKAAVSPSTARISLVFEVEHIFNLSITSRRVRDPVYRSSSPGIRL